MEPCCAQAESEKERAALAEALAKERLRCDSKGGALTLDEEPLTGIQEEKALPPPGLLAPLPAPAAVRPKGRALTLDAEPLNGTQEAKALPPPGLLAPLPAPATVRAQPYPLLYTTCPIPTMFTGSVSE